ncbi:hypothetical protein QA612_09890 [Evansella sp. AB-P1]|uniref:hypothetical protein n=1 Tax=Evansella sp. AB-P1 TaxID=3037653 RepID=UPI00241C638A|nr:hypothetical protein [Evansella sp. AB-P1]MDG5787810.1 hypothetical protein [Evansella sp. AB-P1]
MKKILSNSFFIFATLISFTALCTAFTLILFIINRGILVDETNINIFEIILRTSFVFIGSFLSGFVAFFIYYLNNRKESLDKDEEQEKFLKKINSEYSNNVDIIKSIYEAIGHVPSEKVFELITEENGPIKELVIIHYSKLDLTFYTAFCKELSIQVYSENSDQWNKVIRIRKYLDLLLNTVTDKSNAVALIDEVKSNISSL